MSEGEADSPLGYIYFIYSPLIDSVKIGWSLKNPNGRFSTLQTASPVKLQKLALMHGRKEDESRLHFQFRKDRQNGEWFALSGEIKSYIERAAQDWDELLNNDSLVRFWANYEHIRAVTIQLEEMRSGDRERFSGEAAKEPLTGAVECPPEVLQELRRKRDEEREKAKHEAMWGSGTENQRVDSERAERKRKSRDSAPTPRYNHRSWYNELKAKLESRQES